VTERHATVGGGRRREHRRAVGGRRRERWADGQRDGGDTTREHDGEAGEQDDADGW
jgi:hypothetical protein